MLGNTSLGQAHDGSVIIPVVYARSHTHTKKEKTRTQKCVICVNSTELGTL